MPDLNQYMSDLVDQRIVPVSTVGDCLPPDYFPQLQFEDVVGELKRHFGDIEVAYLRNTHFGSFSIGEGLPTGHVNIPTRLLSCNFIKDDYEISHGLSFVFCSDNKWRLTSDIYKYDLYWNASFPIFSQGHHRLSDLLFCMKLHANSLDVFR